MSNGSILMLNKYDEQVIHAVGYARKNVREYGKFYSKNRATAIYYMNLPIEKLAFNSFVDLYDLAQLINESVENQAVKDACKEVMDKINSLIKKGWKVEFRGWDKSFFHTQVEG